MDAASVPSLRDERRPGARRRYFRSVEQKRQMVQETLVPGASVAIIARRHENANQLFSWRRQYRRGALELVKAPASEESALVPIAMAQINAPQDRDGTVANESQNTGRIDIEFSGGRRVTVWGQADLETLSAILREFSRT